MSIPPEKPHFFTIVFPDSQFGALIPISFMCKYLNVGKCDYAMLTRECMSWAVKIDGRLFAKGWEKFKNDNGLEIGDFIVFRHEGHLVFEVLVFDSTFCEREFPPASSSDVSHGVKKVDGTRKGKKSTAPEKTSKKPTPNTHGSKKRKKEKVSATCAYDEEKSTKLGNSRSFRGTLAPCSIAHSVLYMPREFAWSNGLNRNSETIFRDEKLRSWPVCLRSNGSDQFCFGRGWRDFRIGNDLKLGNEFVLELVENGEKPILKFQCLGKNRVKTPEEAETTTSAIGASPYFIAILDEFSIKKSTLYLPIDFARENGLRDGEMVLRNENQNSWLVELGDEGKYVYIGLGWHDFQVGNNLKEGDWFKFELVESTKKPIVNFTRL